MKEKISVLLSTYNEKIEMIEQSVDSILNQTYTNFELLLINDNPAREELDEFLIKVSQKDQRINYIKHEKNMGLIDSLNAGIKCATGKYIARMDADDISCEDRFEKQIKFLEDNSYDFIGCSVIKIDEAGRPIGRIIVPSTYKDVCKYNNYGNCVLHPTWLVKKIVYDKLGGYRDVYACEDYDFLVRAIQSSFRIGNVPECLLFYRIRNDGISESSYVRQKLTMYYIIKHKRNMNLISSEDITKYIQSSRYKKNAKLLIQYKKCIDQLRQDNTFNSILINFKVIFNKYLYINLLAHLKIKQREKLLK